MKRRLELVLSLVVLGLLLGSCASRKISALTTPTLTPSVFPGSSPGCQPSPIIPSAAFSGQYNVQGTIPTGQHLWAVLDGPGDVPLHAQHEYKIIWDMTGSGPLHLVAQGPQDTPLQPVDGPQPPLGAATGLPGDEWGTDFLFPVPGCWLLKASRDQLVGSVVLMLVP